MSDLVVFVVLGLGINGLVQLCVPLNITSLVILFYHNRQLAIKLFWKYLQIVRASIKDVPLNLPAIHPHLIGYCWRIVGLTPH